jgi:hypothetical protein
VKRLYDSSLGRLEIELEIELSIWLFDEDGRVAKESGNEWEYADLPDLLQDEIGLPEPEAQSIAARFLEAYESEGHARPDVADSGWGAALALMILLGFLVVLGIGIWTIVTNITVAAVVVALLIVAIWLVPAFLILRWWDRRRGRDRSAP